MNNNTYKIELKLIRHFSIGFTIYSPKYNGFCISFDFMCFNLHIWGRGEKWFKFNSYWNW